VMKTGNPNKDGQPVIPLTGAFETAKPQTDITTFLMNAFIYDDPSNHYFMLKDNKVQLAAIQPEWKQGLQYMNKLYSEGLIDQAAFTQTSDVVKREIAQNPSTIGVVPYANNTFLNITDKDMRWVNWVAVPPLTGPGGASFAQWQPGGVSAAASFAITSKASKDAQIKAVKLADYLYTYEGTLLGVYGQQDKFWKAAAPTDLGVNGQPAKYWVDDTSFFAAGNVQNSGWDQMGPVYQSTEFRQSEAQNQDPNTVAGGIQRRLYLETLNKYKGHGPQNQYPRQIYLDAANVDKANQLTQQINDYIKQNTAAFAAGQKSLDKDWDSYVQGLNNLGLADYLKIYQDAFNQVKTPAGNFADPFGA
ncbi:MAG: transporter substrate-binding protein, partial [Bacilli bacterium]|nr:transporter substrate-binding protein [Bacilli bacterium]